MRAETEAGEVLIPVVLRATGLLARMRGLLGRGGLPQGQALHLLPCAAVHTVGMRFALDLVFLDRSGVIVRVVQDVGAGRLMVAGGAGAHSVLELQAGWAGVSRLVPGQRIVFRGESA